MMGLNAIRDRALGTLFRHLVVFSLLVLTYGAYVGTSLLPGLLNRWDIVTQVAIGTVVFYGNVYGIFPWAGRQTDWKPKCVWMVAAVEWLVIALIGIAISVASGALEIRIGSLRGVVLSVGNVFAAFFPLSICLVYSVTYYAKEKLRVDRQRLLGDVRELEKRLTTLRKKWTTANLPEHFLLNTLGALREMSLSGSPHVGEAYDAILDILHYCLRTRDKVTVSTKKELRMVRKLILFMNLKYENLVQLQVETNDKLKYARIVPLGILTLVENVFAHGRFLDKAARAELCVEYRSPYLFVSTKNRLSHSGTDRSTGFGLSNLEQRLQHGFPDAFLLEHGANNGWFHVSLVISMDGQLPDSPPSSAVGSMEIFS